MEINTFINTYETLPYDNVSYIFTNVFIFKICMGREMVRKPSARYNNMVKKYIFTPWDLLGLAPLDETDVFVFKFKSSFV